ncbi:MAG TPA: hypothetical protein VL546_02130 [Steroidobacteraceae bacterium]|nr:hypothetical protein [Steroidobacteraceae bacterium]
MRSLPILLTSTTAIGGLLPLAVQGSGLSRRVTPVMYKMLPPAVLRRPMQATPVPA